MTGKQLRIDKLFNKSDNAVIVAIDHGLFDGPITGMVNMKETAQKIDSSIDGVLLSPGMLKQLKEIFNYKGAPMPIVRLNWSSVYCFHWNYNDAYTVLAQSVDEAVANGAEIVLASLTMQTTERNDTDNIKVYSRLVNAADKMGIPIIGEYYPAHSDIITPDQLQEQVYTCCRILTELGCDMIKTFYTHAFKSVTESCPVPVFGLGAEKKPTQLEALQLANDEIKDGARGVVFGRNAIQVTNPQAFQKALVDVVKHGLTPQSAIEKYGLID